MMWSVKNLINSQYYIYATHVDIKMRSIIFKNTLHECGFEREREAETMCTYARWRRVRRQWLLLKIRKVFLSLSMYLIVCVHKCSHNWAITIGYQITLNWSTIFFPSLSYFSLFQLLFIVWNVNKVFPSHSLDDSMTNSKERERWSCMEDFWIILYVLLRKFSMN